jgi:hypothetical protein
MSPMNPSTDDRQTDTTTHGGDGHGECARFLRNGRESTACATGDEGTRLHFLSRRDDQSLAVSRQQLPL